MNQRVFTVYFSSGEWPYYYYEPTSHHLVPARLHTCFTAAQSVQLCYSSSIWTFHSSICQTHNFN